MRPLRRIPVPPGAAGIAALVEPLQAALDGSGPAIAPIPTTSPTISATYVGQLLAAVRPDDPAAPLETEQTAVVLATSGSTGAPRGVLLSTAALRAMNEWTTAPGAQWIAALPVTSMGGFNVVQRALASGRAPIALPSIGGAAPFTPELLVDAVADAAADDLRISLVAAQVRRLLEDPAGTAALAQCTQVLVGGGPLPEQVRAQAADAGIALTSTYGATETAGGCVYDGRALPGVEVRIDERGEVWIGGPTVALGYRCDPAASAARFVDGWYRTADAGQVRQDRLVVTGRLDDIVIVNGVNISLHAIEEVVEHVAGISQACALALPGDETRLALVVATVDATAVDVALSALRDRLGGVAVPRLIAILPALPQLANGKIDRQRLRRDALEGDLTWRH